MAIGVTDISEITDKLLTGIRAALNLALPGQTNLTGSMPETMRGDGGCQVSFYLYHVANDRQLRNTSVIGPQTPPRQRPFGLELYYLLTAFAAKDYIKEQQAMTVAMRALFDQPYLRLGPGREELTVTLEAESIDKLGILWQAVSAPFRLTAMYKVAIAFLSPPDVEPPPAPKPTTFSLTADPVALPFGDTPVVAGTWTRIKYLRRDGVESSYDLSPAVVPPGGLLYMMGASLNLVPSNEVFLLDADGTNERNVTAWRAAPAALHSSSRLVLQLPATVGAAPVNAPSPGTYLLRAGGTAGERTNSTPFGIAPLVTVGVNPPILAAVGGLFTVNGAGFIGGRTEVLLETNRLIESAGAPTAGQFQVQAGGASITLRAPAGIATGFYAVRIRVNGIEAPPSWWVNL